MAKFCEEEEGTCESQLQPTVREEIHKQGLKMHPEKQRFTPNESSSSKRQIILKTDAAYKIFKDIQIWLKQTVTAIQLFAVPERTLGCPLPIPGPSTPDVI